MRISQDSLLVGLLGAGLAATGLTLVPSPADAASTGLVISEVYGGGGNSGGVFRSDFIELYNPTSASVSLDGLSLQYRSTSGSPSPAGPFALSGSLAAGQHYLVKAADGTDTTQPALPTPDAAATFTISGTGGQVLLVNGTAAFTGSGNVAGNPALVDMVGWGSSTTYEGAPAAATTNATSTARIAGDTDANNADFATGAPTPQAAGAVPPPSGPVDATIAEIQGTGDTTPLAGKTVTTRGVVTGVYADPYDSEPGMTNYGGFDGFYLQTGGTGGASDATPEASDAVFVYTGNDLPAGLSAGDSVEVTGAAKEFSGLTEVDVTGGTVSELATALDPVKPEAIAYPTTAAGREAQEGMLLAPTDRFTVTNSYATNQYGEIGLATGDHPLVQPTEVARPGTPELAAVEADNAARGVVLDDGTSINYLATGSAQQDYPVPWLSKANPVRVGAAATLRAPVVLDYRNSTWKLQPTHPVTDEGTDVATFENTRADNAAPRPVGGDLHIATFNVLNYFNTTGEDWVAGGHTCTFYVDRDDNPISDNTCSDNGPRGAATDASLTRQQAKIVAAINGLGADIVSLEELENSVVLGEDRDDAVSTLVAALNADAGAGTWAYVPSPAEASDPANVAQQDVIRTGFIYKPATVEPVGGSDILFDTTEFSNAREPLAQAFKAAGAPDSDAFALVAVHMKSKGCGDATGDNADTGDGQSCWNGDRTRQAARLAQFANDFAAARGTDAVFLAGDFNSYSMEDPIQVLRDRGFTTVESDDPEDESYSFSGLSGSLDHVLGNAAATAMVTGADIWEINADESVAFQYSRYNYNVTDFYAPDQFAASDHNPEIVGIDVPDLQFRATSASAVSGKAQVGKALTGTPATFAPAPESVTYQWLADGVPIPGATGTTFVPTAAQVGKQITFRTTASAARYADGVSTSAPTAPVKKGPKGT